MRSIHSGLTVLALFVLFLPAQAPLAFAIEPHESAECARRFVVPFVEGRMQQAAEYSEVDPSEWATWFAERFPAETPFERFAVLDPVRAGNTYIVPVRLRRGATIQGLYVKVNSNGKVTGLSSIHELIDEGAAAIKSAYDVTIEALSGVTNRTAPAAELRRALRDQRRAADAYLDVIERHLEVLEAR